MGQRHGWGVCQNFLGFLMKILGSSEGVSGHGYECCGLSMAMAVKIKMLKERESNNLTHYFITFHHRFNVLRLIS